MDYEFIQTREAMVQSAVALGEFQATHISIYITLLFAYIVAAHLAGRSLTRLQLFLTTFVFVITCVWEILVIVGASVGARAKGIEVEQFIQGNLSGALIVNGDDWIWVIVAFLSTGVLAALTFMWSVRHPRIE